MSSELVKRIIALERRLDRLNLPEQGWTPHFLTTALTNTDFDGDSFSDVAANTKIENTSWSTAIPATAKALLIFGQCRDSGSAATSNLYFSLYGAAASTSRLWAITPSGAPNDSSVYGMGIVPCTDGDIWYRCDASGASTMDVWLYCFGYWT